MPAPKQQLDKLEFEEQFRSSAGNTLSMTSSVRNASTPAARRLDKLEFEILGAEDNSVAMRSEM